MNGRLGELIDREKDVLRLLARGHDAKSAAGVLGVSVNSINERLRDARRKLSVSSSREAARVLWEAEGGTQEAWDEKIGVDQVPESVASSGTPDKIRGNRALLLTLLGVGTMLVIALAASVVMNLGDDQASLREPSPLPAAEQRTAGPAPTSRTLRPTYSVALAGMLRGKPILIPNITVRAGSISSSSRSGVYDVHFVVTPDPDQVGNLLVSVNIVMPGASATSRYSRTLSVADGQGANFHLEAVGATPSPGEVVITPRQVAPSS